MPTVTAVMKLRDVKLHVPGTKPPRTVARAVDFNTFKSGGFYTTGWKAQADAWAVRKAAEINADDPKASEIDAVVQFNVDPTHS